MLRTFLEDLNAVQRNDPAATSRVETLLCHSPLHAILLYRIAHALHTRLRIPLLPRLISTFGRFLTGVEDPPRREDRPSLLHRPRHGRRDRRNQRDRRRLRDVPQRDAGRHRQAPGQAPPQRARQRLHRHLGDAAGAHHRRLTTPRSARIRSSACTTYRRTARRPAPRRASSNATGARSTSLCPARRSPSSRFRSRFREVAASRATPRRAALPSSRLSQDWAALRDGPYRPSDGPSGRTRSTRPWQPTPRSSRRRGRAGRIGKRGQVARPTGNGASRARARIKGRPRLPDAIRGKLRADAPLRTDIAALCPGRRDARGRDLGARCRQPRQPAGGVAAAVHRVLVALRRALQLRRRPHDRPRIRPLVVPRLDHDRAARLSPAAHPAAEAGAPLRALRPVRLRVGPRLRDHRRHHPRAVVGRGSDELGLGGRDRLRRGDLLARRAPVSGGGARRLVPPAGPRSEDRLVDRHRGRPSGRVRDPHRLHPAAARDSRPAPRQREPRRLGRHCPVDGLPVPRSDPRPAPLRPGDPRDPPRRSRPAAPRRHRSHRQREDGGARRHHCDGADGTARRGDSRRPRRSAV